MERLKIIFILMLLSGSIFAQSIPNSKRGTIRVRKTGDIVKVEYDNVNYRLIGIDRFGNMLDKAVIAFEMSVTVQGVFYSEKSSGPALTYKMQQQLSRIDGRTTIFFKKIKAKDNNGTLLDMPNVKYALGNTNSSHWSE